MRSVFLITIIIVSFLTCSFSQEEEIKESNIHNGDNYFSIGEGFGATFPLGDVGSVMDVGCTLSLNIAYNLGFDWGILGVGFYTGVISETSLDNVTYQYNMNSYPLSLSVRYGTQFLLPLYIFIEAHCGVTLNTIQYRYPYIYRENALVLKVFTSSSLGIGYFFTPTIGLYAFGDFILIFFDKTLYMGCSAGAGIEVLVF
jgi:hypothetical protein